MTTPDRFEQGRQKEREDVLAWATKKLAELKADRSDESRYEMILAIRGEIRMAKILIKEISKDKHRRGDD